MAPAGFLSSEQQHLPAANPNSPPWLKHTVEKYESKRVKLLFFLSNGLKAEVNARFEQQLEVFNLSLL